MREGPGEQWMPVSSSSGAQFQLSSLCVQRLRERCMTMGCHPCPASGELLHPPRESWACLVPNPGVYQSRMATPCPPTDRAAEAPALGLCPLAWLGLALASMSGSGLVPSTGRKAGGGRQSVFRSRLDHMTAVGLWSDAASWEGGTVTLALWRSWERGRKSP